MSDFLRPLNEYARDYDFERTAQEDLAFHLSRMRNITLEEARAFLAKTMQANGAHPRKDPEVMYLERNKLGDRERKSRPLSEYLNYLIGGNYILSPSLTAYLPNDRKSSVWAKYIQHNLKLRKSDKKLMFQYLMAKDLVLWAYYKTMQESRKIKNNSLSGLQASPYTAGYNKTAHSALTSLCRCATSFANAANEKFIGGLRHYYAPTIVDNHLITTMRFCKVELIRNVCEKYGLRYPTVAEVMKCIFHSSKHYWHNAQQMERLESIVQTMNDQERAAFMFTGDMYHLDLINPAWVKSFLYKLSEASTEHCPDADEVISSLDDNYSAIASLLNTDLIKGVQLDKAKVERPEAYHAVASTAKLMRSTVESHQDILAAFFKPDALPISIAAFPSSKRMSVPTSDTDSTIFTLQYWADRYGDGAFTNNSWRMMYAMLFMITGMITNTMRTYSVNLGVEYDLLDVIEMKNEYIIPAYVLTNLAKHYYSMTSAQEGNVYDEPVLDRKGVNLRSSNAPEAINDGVVEIMTMIMSTIMEGKLLKIKDVLDYIQTTEQSISDDIAKGGMKYLNSIQIKNPDGYKDLEEATAYKSYMFWNRVFAKKYGAAPIPPYRAIKVNVRLPNKTAIKQWLSTIKDVEFREHMTQEIGDATSVKLFRLPKPNVLAHGIPTEIMDIVDQRLIIREVMKPFYLVLESLGIYITNKNATRVVLDEHDPFFNIEELEEVCNQSDTTA